MASAYSLLGSLFFGAAALVTASVLVQAWQDLARRVGLVQENYRGKDVATGVGVALLLPLGLLVFALVASDVLIPRQAVSAVAGLALLTVGGIVDDIAGLRGDQDPKGWAGHFGMLARTGRMSAGVWKVAFGTSAGLVVAFGFGAQGMFEIGTNALLVPLAANTANLLDLRPGRAAKAVIILLAAVTLIGWFELGPNRISFLVTALVTIAVVTLYARADMLELIMLGDAGANLLGGFSAIYMIFAASPRFRLSMLVLFTLMQIASERISMSVVIQNVPLLRLVDSLGREAMDENGGVGPKNQEEREGGPRIQ